MSFDIFLQKFLNGEPAEADRAAVRALVDSTPHTSPHDGLYTVKFPDGVEVELFADLDDAQPFLSCMFAIRDNSSHLAPFILGVAKAGDMVILPAMEGVFAILISPDQAPHLPPEVRDHDTPPILCDTSAALDAALFGGYAAWRKYRDQILNPPS